MCQSDSRIVPTSALPLPVSSSDAGVAISDVPGDILYQWRLRRRLEQARREVAVANTKLQSGRKHVAGSPCEMENCSEAMNDEDVNVLPKEQLSTSSGSKARESPSGGLKSSRVSLGDPPSKRWQRCDQEICHDCCHSAHPPHCVIPHTHWSCDVFPCQQQHAPAMPCLSNQPRSYKEKKGCCHSHVSQDPRNLWGSPASPANKRTGCGPTTGSVGHSRKRRADVRYLNSLPSNEAPLPDLTSTSEWCSSPSPRSGSCNERLSHQGLDHNLLSQVYYCHLFLFHIPLPA